MQNLKDLEHSLPELLQADTKPKTSGSSAAISDLLSGIRRHLNMDACFIARFQDGRRVFQHVDQNDQVAEISPGQGDPLEDTYCHLQVTGTLPQIIHDTRRHPVTRKMPVTSKLNIGAYMGVPIELSDGSVYGTICCFGMEPNQSLNELDLGFLKLCADTVSRKIDEDLAVARRKAALKRSVSAVLSNGLSMVFQPIADIHSGSFVGFEALSRFDTTPAHGPDIWYRAAARTGLECDLTRRAMELTLADAKLLPAQAYIAFNASAGVIRKRQLSKVLQHAPLNRLVLEVTEHANIKDYGKVVSILKPFREQGLRVAVDDAGAGYASMRHILNLRPDIIKLDRSLIRDIDTGRGQKAMTSALIRFAEETNIKVVAEGVETESELATLSALGVDKVQGYFISRPNPAEYYRQRQRFEALDEIRDRARSITRAGKSSPTRRYTIPQPESSMPT